MTRMEITPEQFEIFVVRELRKAGLEVAEARVRRRVRVSGETGEYDLDLMALLRAAGEERRVLIGCRHRREPIAETQVRRLAERLEGSEAKAALLFATSEYDRAALVYAREHGIALARVVDGRTTHDSGGWGVRGHYPSWLPEHAAQLVALDAAGLVVTAPLVAGQPRQILDRLGAAGRAQIRP